MSTLEVTGVAEGSKNFLGGLGGRGRLDTLLSVSFKSRFASSQLPGTIRDGGILLEPKYLLEKNLDLGDNEDGPEDLRCGCGGLTTVLSSLEISREASRVFGVPGSSKVGGSSSLKLDRYS